MATLGELVRETVARTMTSIESFSQISRQPTGFGYCSRIIVQAISLFGLVCAILRLVAAGNDYPHSPVTILSEILDTCFFLMIIGSCAVSFISYKLQSSYGIHAQLWGHAYISNPRRTLRKGIAKLATLMFRAKTVATPAECATEILRSDNMRTFISYTGSEGKRRGLFDFHVAEMSFVIIYTLLSAVYQASRAFTYMQVDESDPSLSAFYCFVCAVQGLTTILVMIGVVSLSNILHDSEHDIFEVHLRSFNTLPHKLALMCSCWILWIRLITLALPLDPRFTTYMTGPQASTGWKVVTAISLVGHINATLYLSVLCARFLVLIILRSLQDARQANNRVEDELPEVGSNPTTPEAFTITLTSRTRTSNTSRAAPMRPSESKNKDTDTSEAIALSLSDASYNDIPADDATMNTEVFAEAHPWQCSVLGVMAASIPNIISVVTEIIVFVHSVQFYDIKEYDDDSSVPNEAWSDNAVKEADYVCSSFTHLVATFCALFVAVALLRHLWFHMVEGIKLTGDKPHEKVNETATTATDTSSEATETPPGMPLWKKALFFTSFIRIFFFMAILGETVVSLLSYDSTHSTAHIVSLLSNTACVLSSSVLYLHCLQRIESVNFGHRRWELALQALCMFMITYHLGGGIQDAIAYHTLANGDEKHHWFLALAAGYRFDSFVLWSRALLTIKVTRPGPRKFHMGRTRSGFQLLLTSVNADSADDITGTTGSAVRHR